MQPKLALLGCFFLSGWLIYRDRKARPDVGISSWIPTFWVLILASRPLSTWVGTSGIGDDYEYSIEGSPVDRLGFVFLIAAALVITIQRQVNWLSVISDNKMMFAFYLYLLLSVFWASSPFVSFKRLFKDFGNILVGMVILTEINPLAALKSVFIRCGSLLIPLSLVFIRYFPELGRRYNIHSGLMESTGVTFQKNSLGAMVLVSGVILLADLLDRFGRKENRLSRLDFAAYLAVVMIGVYLLLLSDSKTATACLAVGGCILLATRIASLRANAARLVPFALVGALSFLALDKLLGIKAAIVQFLGRDMTFTGRTDVWQALFDLKTNPIIGTGFCDIWSNSAYRKLMPDWVAFSAHNGYMEMYLDGGVIGVGLLVLVLFSVAGKIHRQLRMQDDYGLVRFSILVITAIYNISESIYGRMSPGWFIFLVAAIDYSTQHSEDTSENEPTDKELKEIGPVEALA